MAILEDGFSTRIAFADFPTVSFCEKEVTPPGMQGGGANDVTTMKNTEFRTMAPKKLKTLAESSLVAAYDPDVYASGEVIAMINVNQLITITFPDASKVAFWGWLDEFNPNALVEGEQPTAEVTIIPSNRDEGTGLEAAPVFTPAP